MGGNEAHKPFETIENAWSGSGDQIGVGRCMDLLVSHSVGLRPTGTLAGDELLLGPGVTGDDELGIS